MGVGDWEEGMVGDMYFLGLFERNVVKIPTLVDSQNPM